ncbi:unnamed protein product [Blepharisma stoltei]|uniref:Uncharacterized protein n=1 Tax=Blepharisma stoltei TaxID=1481888 RepID=A0AAU9IF57_9CILI|nr:unnamed protein product [Blepharisma stoltei]
MENSKIFIAAIKKNITPDITASIATKLTSPNKNLQNNGIIICSSVPSIILSALRFQEVSQLPVFHSEILTENPENSKIRQKFYNSEMLNNYFYAKLQGKPWLDFEKLTYYYKHIFLFIEWKFVETHFSENELILQHEYKSAKICTYTFIKKVKLEAKEEDSHRSQELLLCGIKNGLMNVLKENSQELIEILESFRNEINQIVDKAKALSKHLIKRKKATKEGKENIKKLSTKVLNIKTQFNTLKTNIEKIKNTAELLYPQMPENHYPFNLISCLTLQDNDDWELKLNNTTSNYYCQVEIWCIETQSKICEFSLIEPHSKIKKIIKINMPETEVFYKHLIAQTEGKIISDAYTINPIVIGNVEMIEENSYKVNFISMSKTMEFDRLQVACDKIPDAFDAEYSKIEYEESSAVIKFDKVPKAASFVVLDGKRIVSNLKEFCFREKEESDEEDIDDIE